jgi:hypothetical protein
LEGIDLGLFFSDNDDDLNPNDFDPNDYRILNNDDFQRLIPNLFNNEENEEEKKEDEEEKKEDEEEKKEDEEEKNDALMNEIASVLDNILPSTSPPRTPPTPPRPLTRPQSPPNQNEEPQNIQQEQQEQNQDSLTTTTTTTTTPTTRTRTPITSSSSTSSTSSSSLSTSGARIRNPPTQVMLRPPSQLPEDTPHQIKLREFLEKERKDFSVKVKLNQLKFQWKNRRQEQIKKTATNMIHTFLLKLREKRKIQAQQTLRALYFQRKLEREQKERTLEAEARIKMQEVAKQITSVRDNETRAKLILQAITLPEENYFLYLKNKLLQLMDQIEKTKWGDVEKTVQSRNEFLDLYRDYWSVHTTYKEYLSKYQNTNFTIFSVSQEEQNRMWDFWESTENPKLNGKTQLQRMESMKKRSEEMNKNEGRDLVLQLMEQQEAEEQREKEHQEKEREFQRRQNTLQGIPNEEEFTTQFEEEKENVPEIVKRLRIHVSFLFDIILAPNEYSSFQHFRSFLQRYTELFTDQPSIQSLQLENYMLSHYLQQFAPPHIWQLPVEIKSKLYKDTLLPDIRTIEISFENTSYLQSNDQNIIFANNILTILDRFRDEVGSNQEDLIKPKHLDQDGCILWDYELDVSKARKGNVTSMYPEIESIYTLLHPDSRNHTIHFTDRLQVRFSHIKKKNMSRRNKSHVKLIYINYFSFTFATTNQQRALFPHTTFGTEKNVLSDKNQQECAFEIENELKSKSSDHEKWGRNDIKISLKNNLAKRS